MSAQLSAYVDAICDGAVDPVSAQERTASLLAFVQEFPHLSALLAVARAA